MTLAVSFVLWSVVSAAPGPRAGVALTQRSGVNRNLALSRVELVRAELDASRFAPAEDLTSCAGKKPCLVKAARARGWTALITVEAAAILDDAILNVTLLSIDDDGRAFATTTFKGPDTKLAAELPSALRPIRVALDGLLGPVQPVEPTPVEPKPVEPKPVEPKPVEPKPLEPKPLEPKPEPGLDPPPLPPLVASATRPATRWLPLAGALAITAAGGICFGISGSQANRLRTGRDLTLMEIDSLVGSGKALQTFGVAALIGGGIASAASLVLALLWPESTTQPTLSLTAQGASLGLTGVWP